MLPSHLVPSYGAELMVSGLWVRISVSPLLSSTTALTVFAVQHFSSNSIDQFDANFGSDETNLPGSDLRSPPRFKSKPTHVMQAGSCSKYFQNILVRKYFVIIIVHYSHDHISDKGCLVHYVDVPISGGKNLSSTNNPSIIRLFCGSEVSALQHHA